MREILFRGKRTDNGEWVYGSLQCFKGYSIFEAGWKNWISVSGDTVGQYTGLTDKNGIKIFEGDIVTGKFDHEMIIGHIFYGSDSTFFIQRDGLFGIGLNNAPDWVEVIGNIYDNSVLAGEEKKP